MRIDRLSLLNFRNYKVLTIEPDEGVNLILGDNAQGKTNLIEAISYLSMGHSFRTRREQELIRFGAKGNSLTVEFHAYKRRHVLQSESYAGKKARELALSGVKQQRIADVAGAFTTVLFCPEDLLTLKGGSLGRRRLLDQAIPQLRPGYARAIAEYRKLHENKSRILRDQFDYPSMLETLPDFNERLAQCGAVIISYRARYMEKLAALTAKYHSEFTGGREELSIAYQTVSTITDPMAPKPVLYQQILDHQMAHYDAELRTGQCLSGPHKDDFDVQIDGLSLKSFGSQGQIRTAIISLKLAEREIFYEDTGEMPILLLDDVLSELDMERQDFVLNQIQTGQVFITCAERDQLTQIGKIIMIEGGQLLSCSSP